jgi:hypothetical protein
VALITLKPAPLKNHCHRRTWSAPAVVVRRGEPPPVKPSAIAKRSPPPTMFIPLITAPTLNVDG